MANHEEYVEKPKRRSRGGIVFLIILLLLAGAVGYLYYSICKAPLELDDPQKLAASAPMSVEERFAFSSSDRTAQVKLDKTDLWNLILDIAGNDFLKNINSEIASYGLEISGYAIHMDEAGLRLDLELLYKETRLIARVPCDLEFSGNRMILTPTGIKLGVISLPVENLLSKVKLEYDVILPVLDQVSQVGFEEDTLVLTGTMESDVRSLMPEEEKLNQAKLFCKQLQPLVDVLDAENGFNCIVAYLEQNRGSVENLYRDLFTLTTQDIGQEYLTERRGLTQRFFPNIDFDQVGQERSRLREELNARNMLLNQFFSEAVNAYNEKTLTLSDGEFLLKNEPFLETQFAQQQYAFMAETLAQESFFLILVDVENGFIRKTSSFYRIADENQKFTQSVDFNKTYILGLVLRSVDGEPYLMYETEYHEKEIYYRIVTMVKLTEEDVAALRVPGVFGVWTD